MNNKLKGYSLPITPKGESSLVNELPWYFGGNVLEVMYYTDEKVFESFLPDNFLMGKLGPLVSISIMDMVSITEKELERDEIINNDYKECVIKLYCEIEGQPKWFPIITYVNRDFSLIRGYLQGFAKKEAQINVSKPHYLNEIFGTIKKGNKLKGVCERFNDIHIEIDIILEKKRRDVFENYPFCTYRFIPDFVKPDESIVDSIVEIEMDHITKDNCWEGLGKVTILGKNEFTNLQPNKIVCSRCYSQGFRIIGGRVLVEH